MNLQKLWYLEPLKQLKLTKTLQQSYHLNNVEKAFIYLHNYNGTELKTVANMVSRDKRTVSSFVKEADSKNPFAPKDYKKGRWPKKGTKLTERHKEFLMRWIADETIESARKAHSRLNAIKTLKPISYNPVRNFLKSIGNFEKPRLKPELSDKNREKRLEYCRKNKNFDFRKVLFSDESLFQLNQNNQKVFRLKESKLPLGSRLNPNTKIMVWGVICYNGKTSLSIVKDTLKATQYIKILKERRREMLRLFEDRKIWYFLQDGAPSHRPKEVKNYIKRWISKRMINHPAQSPDLNPIEIIWAQMKVKVEKKRPRTKQQLLNAIIESWNSIDKSTIRRVIDGIYQKMDKIIYQNGNIL